eukprot:Sdes_comp21136_c0_seq1m19809
MEIPLVDRYYQMLNCDISVLSSTSKMYSDIAKYVQNTHAATHDSYCLEIENIFEIYRKEEVERYEKHSANIFPKLLLFHGSRTSNYCGILSEGLRIAPAEAPSNGYMFGKGVYFADMVSKSANYCFCSTSNTRGFILVNEVAVGKSIECHDSQIFSKPLPKGFHSVKGIGKTAPDPREVGYFERQEPVGASLSQIGNRKWADLESLAVDEDVVPRGPTRMTTRSKVISTKPVLIPFGKPVKNSKTKSSLLYNEYVVYDVSQFRSRFLLQVKFKFNN